MIQRSRTVAAGCAAAAILLAVAVAPGCSSPEPAGKKSGFLASLEEDAQRDARRKMKEREAEEARRKAMEEDARRRWAEEAARSGGTAAPSAGTAKPAAAAGDGLVYELSDKDLTFLVLNKIRLGYKGSTVSVNCAGGRVELFGEVPSEETKQRLVADIRKLPGVREVVARELFVTAP
jgi:osmotically-inducible protein OsmY